MILRDKNKQAYAPDVIRILFDQWCPSFLLYESPSSDMRYKNKVLQEENMFMITMLSLLLFLSYVNHRRKESSRPIMSES